MASGPGRCPPVRAAHIGLPFAEKINKLDVGGLGDQQMRTHVMPVGAILVFASGLSACADRERVGSASSPSEEAAYNAGAARRDYDRSVVDYRSCLATNASNANACDGQRGIMEAKEAALSASLQRPR